MPSAHVGAAGPRDLMPSAHDSIPTTVGRPARVASTEADARTLTGLEAGQPTKLDLAIVRTQAKAALVGLGWKAAIAGAAIAEAVAAMQGEVVTLERLIFESLRRCPVRKG